MIEKYDFGEIKIRGKNFNHDVQVFWTGEVLSWWREEGHLIDVKDLKKTLEKKPEIIVIGTGKHGMAKMRKEAKNFLKEKGIELSVEMTDKAVEIFNQKVKEGKKVAGLFHLTC